MYYDYNPTLGERIMSFAFLLVGVFMFLLGALGVAVCIAEGKADTLTTAIVMLLGSGFMAWLSRLLTR